MEKEDDKESNGSPAVSERYCFFLDPECMEQYREHQKSHFDLSLMIALFVLCSAFFFLRCNFFHFLNDGNLFILSFTSTFCAFFLYLIFLAAYIMKSTEIDGSRGQSLGELRIEFLLVKRFFSWCDRNFWIIWNKRRIIRSYFEWTVSTECQCLGFTKMQSFFDLIISTVGPRCICLYTTNPISDCYQWHDFSVLCLLLVFFCNDNHYVSDRS